MKHKKFAGIAAALVIGAPVAAITNVAEASTLATCSAPGVDIGNGCLTLSSAGNGYRIAYQKTGGPNITADFNLACDGHSLVGDGGSFTAVAGNTYSYVFETGSLGRCRGILIDQTPSPDVRYYSNYITR